MKKFAFIILAAAALVFASCNKEKFNEETNNAKPQADGDIITFSANIDLGAKTKATLDGLNIVWNSGDYVGIATDNSATIVAYPVEDISTDGTSCTIKVNAVAGATKYYAVFKGRLGAGGDETKEVAADDFSAISFDTATKTFSGLTVGKQQVASGSLSSYLWYTNGYPLSMAGVSDGNTLTMKPCLALVKIALDAESVPSDKYLFSETYNNPTYNVDHKHYYSAVRGFNLYQKGASTINSSGDFTVSVADGGELTVTPVVNENTLEYRQISQSTQLEADTPYYICLIPGGEISSFKLDFLGYRNDVGTLDWAAVYTMSLKKNLTVAPGDFYDLGTLNPLARKRTKNHQDDDAADEQAASFTPAVTIDGVFDDWDGITEYSGERPGGASNSRINAWRMTHDEFNIYFYLELVTEKILTDRNIYVGFDTDRDESHGSSIGNIPGVEQYVKVFPTSASSVNVFIQGPDPRSSVNSSTSGNDKTIEIWSVLGNPTTSTFVELCIPRSKVGLSSAATVDVAVTFNSYNTAKQTLVLE